MTRPARPGSPLCITVLVVGAGLLWFLDSLAQLRGVSGDPLVTPMAGVAFAAGAGSGPRGTAQSTFQSECASCHGADGKGGGWTAWLFGLRARDLTDPSYMGTLKDEYLFQVIKQGGAIFGKPGMPSWGQYLSDSEIRALVVYVRRFSSPRSQLPAAGDAR